MSPERRRSSVPAVEDALLARLTARAGLAGVFVLLGLPAEAPVQTERVYLIGVQANTREHYVDQGARAVLVGEALVKDGDPASAVRSMTGVRR